MGKRKRISDQTHRDHPLPCSPSTEAILCSSEMEVMPDKKPSHLGDPGALPLQPVLDDESMKILNAHASCLGRSIFLKRSRHYYGHQYSRRNSANHASASTSRGKGISSFDERLSFKLASQSNLESKRHAETREKTFFRPDRIRSSSLLMDVVSPDIVKMVCGICEKPLRWAVVAVLVCGHVYHGECLEQRTTHEVRRDPPCPLCAGLLFQVDHFKEQEYPLK